MSTNCHKRESMSIEEATISNMWEFAAIVEMHSVSGCNLQQEDNFLENWCPRHELNVRPTV